MTDPADDGVVRIGERPLRRVAVRQTAGKIGHHSEIPPPSARAQRAKQNGVIRWRWQTHNAAPAEYPGWAAMAWILTPGQVAIGMDGARAFLSLAWTASCPKVPTGRAVNCPGPLTD